MNICKVEDCNKKVHGKGYCNKHYAQKRRRNGSIKCKVPWCNNPLMTRGYCDKHYAQILNHGRILKRTRYDQNAIYAENGIYRMELYNIKSEVIAETFFDGPHIDQIKQYHWGLSHGYAKNHKNKMINLPNFVCGDFEHNYMFDHIDHRPLYNLISNLRIVSRSQNQINRSMQSNNTTGIIGVCWDKYNNKYYADITVNYKKIFLGRFINIQDAITARRKAEIKYHGEYSPNFNKEV